MPRGLDTQAIFATLDAWAVRFGPRFVLGLSGGGDSVALAVLLAHWRAKSGADVLAVSVDHGLKPSSADDSATACAWAKELGLETKTVRLNEPWPKARLQETARDRRHLSLVEAASDFDARLILLAHTSDDQAETIAFRLARKTGLDGLAGMAELAPSPQAQRKWPCLVARPLLSSTRADLRALLVQQGQSWIEDPANANPAFARVRTRSRLGELQQTDRILAIGRAAGAWKAINQTAVTEFLVRCDLTIDEAGNITLSKRNWETGVISLQSRALARLINALSPSDTPTDHFKTERLAIRLLEPDFRGATLAGVLIKQRGPHLHFTLAPGRKGQNSPQNSQTLSVMQKLTAQSGDLDQFVTLLR